MIVVEILVDIAVDYLSDLRIIHSITASYSTLLAYYRARCAVQCCRCSRNGAEKRLPLGMTPEVVRTTVLT
jgi:hypothetical protein